MLFLVVNVNAEAYQNGYIENDTVTQTKDGIKLVKKVTAESEPGLFKVSFEVSGKEATITNQKNIYAVVIFDISGSMLCPSETEEVSTKHDKHEEKEIKCINNEETPNTTKWENAVNGVITFSSELNDVLGAQLSLITFGDKVSDATPFASTAFTSSQFLIPIGKNDLDSAIEKARKALEKIKDSKAAKYIIIISDGEPDNSRASINETKDAKRNGITIYSVGYETNSETLRSISSDNKYYDASTVTIKNVLAKITNEITSIPVATESVLIDVIGDDFTYAGSTDTKVENKRNTVKYDFGTITESVKSFEFLIRLKLPIDTPWHNTNNSAKLVYKNHNCKSKTLSMETSPRVYFQSRYGYTINYYKDNVSETPISSAMGDDILGAVIGEEEVRLFIPRGYNCEEINPLTITSTEADNVLNVICKINNKISYKVEYYYDNVLDESKTETFENKTFGDTITSVPDKSGTKYKLKNSNLPYVLDVENNVIKVYYEKIVVNENEIIPPKTGIEENTILPYFTTILLLCIKKMFL